MYILLGGKVLIYGGGSTKAEVIDLLDNTTQCDLYATLPIEASYNGTFGGRINDDFIFCGGWGPYYYLERCYQIGKDGNFIDAFKLATPLSDSEITTMSLPNNTIFATGKSNIYSNLVSILNNDVYI